MKPPAEVVAQAAAGHRAERQRHPVEQRAVARARRAAQEKPEDRRLRELGRAAESALDRVERGGDARRRVGHACGARHLVRRGEGRRPVQGLDEPARPARHVVAAGAPGLGDRAQQVEEARHAVARDRREVRAAVERLGIRREEHRERPAAAAGHGLDRIHVHGVDVGAFLTVDLDVDEVAVHDRRHRRVLERLVGHHVAPMAGGVADRQQHRLVVGPGAVERGVAPLVPIHRVVGVLEQVRRRARRESVGHVGKPYAGRLESRLAWSIQRAADAGSTVTTPGTEAAAARCSGDDRASASRPSTPASTRSWA